MANHVADARDKGTKKRRRATLKRIREILTPLFGVLGLFESDPAEVLEGIRERRVQQLDVCCEEVEAAIAERNEARAEKDFARSDTIRDELAAKGVLLMDSPEGTSWKCQGAAPSCCKD